MPAFCAGARDVHETDQRIDAMTDDAMNAPSPLWVRVLRMVVCLAIAGAVGWKGVQYDPIKDSAVVPFVMCQVASIVFAMLGLLGLDGEQEVGPS
jgi:hypothetical protein